MADKDMITAVGSLLQGIGTILGAMAVFVAAWLGSRTFETWRQQKLSERLIEQAERIVTATYKVRRGLSYVRNPAIFAYEFAAAEKILKERGVWENASEEQRKRLSTAQVYYNRLNATKDDRLALEECQPIARALFGKGLEQALEKLSRQSWTVEVYVNASSRDGQKEAEFQEQIDAAIYEGYPKPEENEIDQTIAAQVKIIEDVCLPVLRLGNEKRKGKSSNCGLVHG